MAFLFTHTIDGLDAWSRVFCDAKAFTWLVQAIYEKEGLGNPGPLQNLTPGTNAVFACGDTVIKLFAPVETGIDAARDYEMELAAQQAAAGNGVCVPHIIAHGSYQDQYLFRYMIMAHIEAIEAGDAIKQYSKEQRIRFAKRMCALLDVLHKPSHIMLPELDVRARALHNSRLANLPLPLANDMKAHAEALSWQDTVLVHGDLTSENVLVKPDGTIVIIDFADSVLAPACYELAPLVFDLFQCDKDMIDVLRGDQDIASFVDCILSGVAIHDFGANIIIDYAARRNILLDSIDGLDTLRTHLLQEISYGQTIK